MQSLKELKEFGIKKDMDLKELMGVVANNLHGESTIQVQTFKSNKSTVINPQLFEFFCKAGSPSQEEIIKNFGLSHFLDILKRDPEKNDYIDYKYTPGNAVTPKISCNINVKDECRFFSFTKTKYHELDKTYQNDITIPRIQFIGRKSISEDEFIATNVTRELKNTDNEDGNIFQGVRSVEHLEKLLEYFEQDNYHKVVATNEEQGYALVHKITVKTEFPDANYFRFTSQYGLKLDINVNIFHQYFLTGKNDEGGYFITAIVFPDPTMLFDLIRTQDFKPFLYWFNREDQDYKRLQGDILYKIVPNEELGNQTIEQTPSKDMMTTQFSGIKLDTLYEEYLPYSELIYHYDYELKKKLTEVIQQNAGNSKHIGMNELGRLEKRFSKDLTGQVDFNFSHHKILAFGSRKQELVRRIQMSSRSRVNQFVIVYGATRVILEHEQHEARALSVPLDHTVIFSHQRGKDISNLFAD